MSNLIDTDNNEHVPSVSVQVYGVAPSDPNSKVVGSVYRQIRDVQKNPGFQVVRDHLAHISKIAANEKLSVQVRISKLVDLGKKYSDGYPFKNNARLNALRVDGVPVLSRQAHAAADQLLSIEKARYGRSSSDHGKMGNQE